MLMAKFAAFIARKAKFMPDVHVDNLSFAYPNSSQAILRSINLTIPEGEFVLLAGPSGCGKSTLALLLAGLIPSRISGHLRGSVYYGDKHISAMEIQEVAQYIGMVFQNPEEQLIHLDVESEVAFGPENLALSRAEIALRVKEALISTGMEQQRELEIFALSGGQKQRVAISAALAMRSRVLVLDEPTSDLDPVGTQEVLAVLKQLNKQYKMTIVLVEHKIDEIIPWVDRVLLMDRGRIIVDALPRQAFLDSDCWHKLGVAVPHMVQVAQALPAVFGSTIPLSVDEVYDALHGTSYEQTIRRRNAELMKSMVNDQTAVQPDAFTAVQSILSWEHVDLAYGTKQVLRDIDLEIKPHEWVAVVGPNGSGKTSLASLAMGFQAPTRGIMRHRDKIVKTGQISRQAQSTAYLFQAADSMLFTATVEQEFLFGVKHQRKKQATLPFTIDQLLDVTDLKTYRQANPFHLSHGQRKRLAIGALLARFPDMIILDEPTTGQDEGHARAFLQFLQELREHHKFTYMMITHHMQAVAQYATRMIVLKDGHIAMDDAPARVFARTDELAECGILSPPIAQLQARLCEGQAVQVDLSVESFLQALQTVEVM
jgi:energy-coupling factor transporter ATP-binding protein EcfA2